jgi:hypothetical protein
VGKPAGLALLVLGLALGPGLWIAGRYFSGHAIADLPLNFATGPDGRAAAEVRFTLTADALPASIVVQAFASHGPSVQPADTPGDRWEARLAKDGRTLREQVLHLQSHTVEATPALVFKKAIPLEAALGGGAYALQLTLPAAPRLTLESARVQVRANVRETHPAWLAAGLGLAAAGAVLLVLR